MKTFIFAILVVTSAVATCLDTMVTPSESLRLRREADPKPEPGNRPNIPTYIPPPRPPHPRLRREADPEPEPGNRPIYIPPPRPPHPRLRREADPEPKYGKQPKSKGCIQRTPQRPVALTNN
ncbi:hypothetical protein QLX08_004607 [Tetragonisca angustula]|uniref:Uncharacterized protein n=1 Tax=Tetragonisca angustula TaxID=166442 RepID=A0AAW1A1Y7_9HYME